MIKSYQSFFCLITLFLTFGHAFAQKQEIKKQVISFEDELVEGKTAKPDLMLLLQQRKINFKRLIKLRENFIPEVQSDQYLWRGSQH